MRETHQFDGALSPAVMRAVDRTCDRFEAAWRAGARPRIEDYLSEVPAADQPTVLRELIALEVELRAGAGEAPRWEEYRGRFPAVAALFGPRGLPEVLPLPPRYELVGLIGRGGVGAVYRCRDRELGRDLALKVLLEEHQGLPERVTRFVREAQVCSQLQHPAIVPVYEVGHLADGLPYFTMKLVEGRTLAQCLADPANSAADLGRWLGAFGQICQAVAFAHSKGVLHRDIKPHNVMLGAFGEVLVMDWGMAKVLTEASDGAPHSPDDPGAAPTVCAAGPSQPTENDVAMGTPGYMPPEQARGEIDRLDARCDVFALGAVLCEVLTGQPLYAGSANEVIAQARQGDLGAALTRLAGCGADVKLVTLARHCLAPEEDGRPRDAGVVADAMTTYFVELEALRAKTEVKAAEERGRRRLQVTLLAVVGPIILGIPCVWAWFRIDAAARAAETARQQSANRDRLINFMEALQAVIREERGGGVAELEKLNEDLPADPVLRLKYAQTWNAAGDLYRLRRQFDRALKAHGEAEGICGALQQEFPDQPEYQAEQAAALQNLALTYSQAGDVEKAEQYYTRAKKLLDKLESV